MNKYPCKEYGAPGWVQINDNGVYYLCRECYLRLCRRDWQMVVDRKRKESK